MEKLNQDFLAFIGLLERHQVDYLIVGGYAVGFHGFPRYTGDIDFFIAINDSNARSMIKVFNEFGFGDIDIAIEDFLRRDFVVEIGREPRKIQILTGIDGVSFDECSLNRVEVDYHGQTIPFIGIQDLIRNKAASGRAKDLIDLEELQKLGD